MKRCRAAELVHIRKFRLVQVLIIGMGRASPILANCITFCLVYAQLPLIASDRPRSPLIALIASDHL